MDALGKDDSDDDATVGLATLRTRLDTALSVWHCVDAMPTTMLLHDAVMLCVIRQCCARWDGTSLCCDATGESTMVQGGGRVLSRGGGQRRG